MFCRNRFGRRRRRGVRRPGRDSHSPDSGRGRRRERGGSVAWAGDFIITKLLIILVISKPFSGRRKISVVYYISFEQLQHIYQAFPSFNSNVRVLTEKYYQLADERNYMLR